MKKTILTTARFFLPAALGVVLPVLTQATFGDSATYVGDLVYGDGEFRTDAYFDFPEDITSDGAGNFYIADTFNGVIRKIDNNGFVSTVVGQGGYGDVDAATNTSKFAHPSGVAVDDSGNVYIADAGNGKIKKFSGGRVTTLKSGLDRPEGIFVRNSKLYVTDYGTGKLYSMNLDGGSLQTITSSLNGPKKIYVRTSADYAYITNANDYTVVRVKLSSGTIQVVAGTEGESGKANGSCSVSGFKNLWGLTVIEGATLETDDIYVTDGTGDPGNVVDRDLQIQNTADAGKIRVIDIDGSDVPVTDDSSDDSSDNDIIVTRYVASEACETYLFAKDSETLPMNYPNSIARYGDSIYVAVTGISEVLRFTIGDAADMENFAGQDRFHNRNGKNGLPGRPKDLVISDDKKHIYYTENNKVKSISTSDQKIHKLVGNTVDNYQRNDDRSFVGAEGRFSDTLSLGLSKNQDTLYVVDRNNNRIREVDIARKTVSYFTGAGDVNVGGGFDNGYQEGRSCPNQFGLGRKNCAYFTRPGGIVMDHSGKYAYVADTGNEVIRRLTLTGSKKGETKLIAGNPGESGFKDGTRTNAEFNVPISLTIDGADNFLYVADRNNHAIRKVRISDGQVTTVTGDPSTPGYLDGRLSDAYLNYPVEVYYNRGNVYFSEAGTHMVRVIDSGDEAVKLVAGDGNRGYSNGDRDNTQFDNPVGIVRKGNNLLVADSLNDLIRKIDLGDGETIPFTDPAAVITSVSPASNRVAGSSSDTKALQIFGENFTHGATVFFGPYEATATFVNSDTELSVVIPFGLLDPGYYEVGVENVDGQIGSRLRAYSVSDTSGSVPVVDYFIED